MRELGEGVLADDGSIDRGRVAEVVFADRSKLDFLEQASTTQRLKAWTGHAIASTVGRLRPARRDA